MSVNKPPGPGIWPSIIVFAIGISLFTWGAWGAFNSAFEILTAESFETPGSQTRELEAGAYEIYARSGQVSILDFDATLGNRVVELQDITVTNIETGTEVPVLPLSLAEGLTRNSNIYDGVGQFVAIVPGSYRVEVAGTEESLVVFGRSIESAGDRIVRWLVIAGIGALLLILGLGLLITGIIRRSRAKRTEAPPSSMQAPPADHTRSAPIAPTHSPPPPPAVPPSSDATPWD